MHHGLNSGSDRLKSSQSQQVESCAYQRGHHSGAIAPVAMGNGVQVLALLRTLALNLLRCNGFRSICADLIVVAHDISRLLGWVGISAADMG
jgi:hypothetical protein